VGRPWDPPRVGRLPVPHIPWAHARLEAVGVVLGQRQPPPPAPNASATRIYPRSRSWSQGVGSPGIDAHQAWPGGGQKSSQSHDDDSSSQARGSQIQAGNGIVTHRIKIGLVMNSSSTVSAEVGRRLVTTPQTIVPLTGRLSCSRQDPAPPGSRSTPGWKSPSSGSSPATCCRGASRAARAPATCKCGPRLHPRAASPAAC
jgi:hypothetical protein